MRRTEEISRFNATDDEGNTFEVIVMQEFAITEMDDGNVRKRFIGSPTYALSDGQRVEMIDASTFKVSRGNKIIRKV